MGRKKVVIFLLMEKYEIMDVIDEGAYGIVWKAVNRETGKTVAIKEFKQGDDDQFSRKSIQRQIRMLKMLKGDFVVEIQQAFKKRGKIYLIFQYFPHNLLNVIEKYDHGLQSKLINFIIYKIVKCIQYLHSKNIIHRDVKPENILLTADYTGLKICDFGFARFLPEKNYDLTDYVATRWYRSPELLVGEPYGKPADIWALGCMIGELVDGQPMFPGDDQIDQISLINNLVGNLTSSQSNYFRRNQKFEDIQLPEPKRDETIDLRYLGKIEKNALSFMKACLRMDPAERLTVQQALKHPYLMQFSLQFNQFANDELNLLDLHRKNQIKNDSKATIVTIREQQGSRTDLVRQIKNTSIVKKGLKLQAGSMNQQQLNYPTLAIPELSLNKKKSQANMPSLRMQQHVQKQKSKGKKLSKMMSEQKNLKLNLDVNLKINLKFNQRSVEKRESRDNLQSKIDPKVNLNNIVKSKLLPDIKNNNKEGRYQLNLRHQKPNQLITIIGETKELIKGSKINLHH